VPSVLLIEDVEPENTGVYTCVVVISPEIKFIAHGTLLVFGSGF